MKREFLGFLIVLFPLLTHAQHFGFSKEVSSYAQGGSSEVQISGLSAYLCRNKATGNLVAAAGSQVMSINENNGTIISRFGSDDNLYSSISDITTDNLGNYYILMANSVLKYDANGDFVSGWGTAGAGNGQFNYPESICTDNVNNVYVADSGNDRVQKFDAQGNFLTKWGTTGTSNGQFDYANGIAYWPTLNQIIVGDSYQNHIQSFTTNGVFVNKVTVATGVNALAVDEVNNRLMVLGAQIAQYDNSYTLINNWGLNGVGGSFAYVTSTVGLAVAGTTSPRAFIINNSKLISYALGGAGNGTLGGTYGSDGTSLGQFVQPRGADYSGTGATSVLHVVDWGKIDPVTQVAAATLNKGNSLKTPSASPMKLPWMLWTDQTYQYIFDVVNVPTPSNHYEIHKFDLNNNFVGKISIAMINAAAMTMDASGNFYFARQSGQAYDIYKFSNTGAQLPFPPGFASWIHTPISNAWDGLVLACDRNDNLYVAYSDNATGQRSIIKYNSSGTLLTTLGTMGYGDGFLGGIQSIDVDDNGNIYVLENNRFQIFDASFNFLQSVKLTAGIKPGSVYQPFLIRASATGDEIAILDNVYLNRVQYFKIKTDQTISFAALPSKNLTDVSFQLSATGGASGNVITYKSSNPAVATISGNTVTLIGGGTTLITASQAGNTTYNAAQEVIQQLVVAGKVNQVIQFAALSNKNYGDASFQLAATGGASGNAIIYTSSNTNAATVSGSTVTIVGAGTTTITANQAGNTNYNAAAAVPQSLTINKASQTIAFSALANKNFDDVNFTLTATGGASGNPIVYSSSNTSVATVSGNTVTIAGTGTTTLTASQPGNANYNAAPDAPQSFTVLKGSQLILFAALPDKNKNDAPFLLEATGGQSGNVITYSSSNASVATITGNTVTIHAAGTTTITASQAGNTNFNAAADAPQLLTIKNTLGQTIAFAPLADITFGAPAFALSATATSGLTIAYSTADDEVTLINSQVTIIKPGHVEIKADQAGDHSFDSAPQVMQGFCINPAQPVIAESFIDPSSPLLTSSSTSGNQWFLNGMAITGATGSTYAATQPGLYTLQVTAETCQSALSEPREIVVTGLNKEEVAVSVVCVPNPTSEFITIHAPVTSYAKVFVYNLRGQLMMSGGGEYLNQPLSISDYPEGIYFARLQLNETTVVRKFIKK